MADRIGSNFTSGRLTPPVDQTQQSVGGNPLSSSSGGTHQISEVQSRGAVAPASNTVGQSSVDQRSTSALGGVEAQRAVDGAPND